MGLTNKAVIWSIKFIRRKFYLYKQKSKKILNY